MVAEPGHREGAPTAALEGAVDAIEALADAGARVAAAHSLPEALAVIADGLAQVLGAEAVVVRVADEARMDLTACAVSSVSTAVAAELEGTRVPLAEVPLREVHEVELLPAAVGRAARRVRANAVRQLPVATNGELVGSLELFRTGEDFDASERRLARLAAAQAALALKAFSAVDPAHPVESGTALTLAGDALAAGADETQTAEQVARLAAAGTGAPAALLWRRVSGRPLELIASFGLGDSETRVDGARAAVLRALASASPMSIEDVDGAAMSTSVQLGHPPIGALQLLFPPARTPSEEELARIRRFAVRAAHALRASGRSQTIAAELERTRTLLTVVGQAIAQLSLAHTLETAVSRVAELLSIDRLAVYLREDDRLYEAAGVGLAGPHVRLAQRLFDLALGPFRGRGMLAVRDASTDSRLAAVQDAAAETGIEAAVAVPLLVRDEAIGLLVLFPPRGRTLTDNEKALLNALAAQLAVAVQNAQLHEKTKQLFEERDEALASELAASKQLRALYEISRSFAQSLSLDATLEALVRTITDVLEVDVALIRMPDERREWLLPRAIHVRDERAADALHTIVWLPTPFGAHRVQRLFRLGEGYEMTAKNSGEMGPAGKALAPFLRRGWTAAVVPIATPAEVLATLKLVSMRPEAPLTREKIEQAEAIAGQAALAIDNARLYQQQKKFADTMQRSLLPRTLPSIRGLDLGHVYQSSARVEVGGDVYDFVELADGRLAVVLGDVTGHGIEAAADMAMAKFVFRSLAREHPEPGDFLQSANDVIVGEIAPGKFITMAYLLVDAESGTVAGAGAGHPPARVVMPDGVVTALEANGLVLGIEARQRYEEVQATLPRGGAVVLYTDGVLEARREGELYGFERLDAIVSAGRELSAQDLAETVLADCRDFANNELADDCAVVVIKRVS